MFKKRFLGVIVLQGTLKNAHVISRNPPLLVLHIGVNSQTFTEILVVKNSIRILDLSWGKEIVNIDIFGLGVADYFAPSEIFVMGFHWIL